MANMNMIQALNSAMDIMLGKDPSVVLMGEDIGYFGGVFRATEGLQRKYGEHRVIDSPIAEGGIVAAAIGMGVNGLRPVAEIQFADYIYPGFDQIVSELARTESFNRFRGTEWMPEPCRSCPQKEIDFGGCRCQAALLTGDASNTDPACELSKHHPLVQQARTGNAINPGLDSLVFRRNPIPLRAG